MLTTYITVAAVSYLLGSIPFGYILVKLFLKQDIRQTGSGNIGATNVARSGKKGLAIATLLLDAAKGAIAVYFCMRLADCLAFSSLAACFENGPHLYSVDGINRAVILAFEGGPDPILVAGTIATLGAVMGHMFPAWLKFRGGKGVATGLGAFLILSPRAVGLAFAIFLVCFTLSRVVSLSSVASAFAFPILLFALEDNFRFSIILCLVSCTSLLIILKHHANIRRLLNGTEPKFTTKKKTPDSVQVEKNA